MNNHGLDNSPISNISNYRRDLLRQFDDIINEIDQTNITMNIVDQTNFDLSPSVSSVISQDVSQRIIVNKVVNRVGRPRNSKKRLGFFNLDKPKRVLEKNNMDIGSPISKRTRSKN